MVDYAKLIAANQARWRSMKVRPECVPAIDRVARRLISQPSKDRFMALSAKTGVPWAIIAVIKERECGADSNWARNIANGQTWDQVTTIVPKGRGPFSSWADAAYDALAKCPPYAAEWKDWSIGGALTLLEEYNGLGYDEGPIDHSTGTHYPPQASPYIWASTDQYIKGKYVLDGVFSPNVVDQQIGCAPLLARMIELDSSANFFAKPIPAAHKAAAGAATAAAGAAAYHLGVPVPVIIGAFFVATVAAFIITSKMRK